MSESPKPMARRQREAVIADLADNLWSKGSWCGETHLQKASFALESLFGVPLGLDHILYKFGPYSSELSDELVAMRADGLLDSKAVKGYGPRLATTEAAETQLYRRWPRTVARFKPASEFVADRFGSKGVGELERLATAIWVRREAPDAGQRDQAISLNQIKPHVSVESAENALATVAMWEAQARAIATPILTIAPKGRNRRGA